MDRQHCGPGSGHHQHGFGFGMGDRSGEGPWAQAGAWTGKEDWRSWAGQRRGGPPPWLADIVRSFGGPDLSNRTAPKVRRGDVRLAILDVLSGQSLNGYQVIQQIGERTDGAWKPSPGSVYPTLQQLVDEGLVDTTGEGRGTEYTLSEAGRTYVAENAEQIARTWATTPGQSATDVAFHESVTKLRGAIQQLRHGATDEQRAAATEKLDETRRALYLILAE